MSVVLQKVRTLLELVKFEHSVFALPYAYIGALYGAATVEFAVPAIYPVPAPRPTPWVTLLKWPTLSALVWITVAMVGARAFAFVLNRAIDKEIDARNPRTVGRAVPAGRIKAWELWLFASVMLVAYLYAALRLAPLTQVLWPIPLVAFVVYPYTKRFTPMCHYWLGICLGLAPVAGWIAVGAPISAAAPWVLGVAVALWTAGFDMIYATQDVECDVRDHLHSMPADLGVAAALVQTRITHVATVLLLLVAGVLVGAGWSWYVGIGVAAALLWYENSIVHADDLSRVDAAFFTVNGVIAVVVFAGALADRLLG
ncbi:MAG: putative 4-hydroxybenzoate polyprenyltransferase [Actinomycetia bacterium]|nr:putative 4-hydroxybenzoate polyprenyltransferase [Actinomycetes bacterium]